MEPARRRGERGRRPRELIDWAIGPVWEANHVWLIFVLVVLWTGFSSAFEAIFSTLVHPAEPRCARDRAARLRLRVPAQPRVAPSGRALAATIFGLASVLTPFFMGTVVGAIAGGRVPVGNAAGDPVTSWLNPLSVVIGALFVATCAYLSAVFLVSDARRAGAPDLERYFGTRALVSAVVTGALAAAGLVVLRSDARFVFDGLKGDALPLVILSVVCGVAVLVLLRRNARRGARALAVGAVACVIWALGRCAASVPAAEEAHHRRRGSSERDLDELLVVFGVAVLVVLPALGLLFTLVQRNLVRETSSPTSHDKPPADTCAADDGPHLATRGNGGAAMNRKQAALTVTRVSPCRRLRRDVPLGGSLWLVASPISRPS